MILFSFKKQYSRMAGSSCPAMLEMTNLTSVFIIFVLIAVGFFSSCTEVTRTDSNSALFDDIFPSATGKTEISLSEETVEKLNIKNPKAYEIAGSAGLLGFCVESDVVSRSGPFRIRVLLDGELHVKQATVISYPWDRGGDVRKAIFTKQFEGKGINDLIQVGRDIDVITGATNSSQVMTEGVRKLITLVNVFESKS